MIYFVAELIQGIEDAHARRARWSATGLPPGMWCDEGTGLLLGAPEQAGTYNATITGRAVLRWPWSWLRRLRVTRG